jgi:hypothetical protein
MSSSVDNNTSLLWRGSVTQETQSKIREIVDSERFNNIVFVAILASSISIGFETYDWGGAEVTNSWSILTGFL